MNRLNKNTLGAAGLVMLWIASSATWAGATPQPNRLDARTRTVAYRPGQVVRIPAQYAQETLVTFGEHEVVVYVGVGDKHAWSVSHQGRYLFLKPTLDDADTNMNVLTRDSGSQAVRAYAFELDALEAGPAGNSQGLWQLVFRYPEHDQAADLRALATALAGDDGWVTSSPHPTGPQAWYMDYSFSGDTALAPSQMMDDGTFTYLRFSQDMTLPAMYLVGATGTERLVNAHMDGDYVVIQRVADHFRLRQGALVTDLYREQPTASR